MAGRDRDAPAGQYNGTDGTVPHEFTVTHDADDATVRDGASGVRVPQTRTRSTFSTSHGQTLREAYLWRE